MTGERWISQKDAARLADCSVPNIDRARKRGEFVAKLVRIEGKARLEWRIDLASFNAWRERARPRPDSAGEERDEPDGISGKRDTALQPA